MREYIPLEAGAGGGGRFSPDTVTAMVARQPLVEPARHLRGYGERRWLGGWGKQQVVRSISTRGMRMFYCSLPESGAKQADPSDFKTSAFCRPLVPAGISILLIYTSPARVTGPHGSKGNKILKIR